MNRLAIGMIVSTLIVALLSGCTGAATTPTTPAWAAATSETTLATTTAMSSPSTTVAVTTTSALSVEEQAAAEAFTSGLIVFLYDPRPENASDSTLDSTEFKIRYIVSPAATPVDCAISVWAEDAPSSRSMGIYTEIGLPLDWTARSGEFTLSPNSLDELYTTQAEPLIARNDIDHLSVQVLEYFQNDDGTVSVGVFNPLSNSLLIPFQ